MRVVDEDVLKEIARRIVEGIHPEKIILFGSRAWGIPDEWSDVDLFVIVDHSDDPSYERARRVYSFLHGVGIPVDVIVRTREEVESSREVVTSLTRAALDRGRTLYG